MRGGIWGGGAFSIGFKNITVTWRGAFAKSFKIDLMPVCTINTRYFLPRSRPATMGFQRDGKKRNERRGRPHLPGPRPASHILIPTLESEREPCAMSDHNDAQPTRLHCARGGGGGGWGRVQAVVRMHDAIEAKRKGVGIGR